MGCIHVILTSSLNRFRNYAQQHGVGMNNDTVENTIGTAAFNGLPAL
jgi:hypothetical protein